MLDKKTAHAVSATRPSSGAVRAASEVTEPQSSEEHHLTLVSEELACDTLGVLAGVVCQLDTGWSYHRERSFSWGSASMRSSCGAFSQLVIKGEGPLWVVPSLGW